MLSEELKKSVTQTMQTFKIALPIIIGVLLLVNLINISLNAGFANIFTGHPLIDSFIGAGAGSISFGIPLTSFIVGGELLARGVSLLAVTAFIIAWSSVGVAMLPLESVFLGKRFSIIRNALNFIFSILIAIITVFTLNGF